MELINETQWTPVELSFIAKSGMQPQYDGEMVSTVEVENIYELGKLVALRFLEWVYENPHGVVALPTGRTPEYFIKTLEIYKNHWNDSKVKEEIQSYGISRSEFPDTSNLKFVMLDEFFPMHPTHKNSFFHYVNVFYIQPLGIKKENVYSFDLIGNGILTSEELDEFKNNDVDLSLLEVTELKDDFDGALKKRKDILHRVSEYCQAFESNIKLMGGIGFFLGGIGPDGHIAFNQEGSSHDSITRLVNFNYPTAAAAAGDLGGIEIARGKAAMTIGLQTITAKRDAVIIIMAAGEGKSTVVREAIEEPKSHDRPASSLHYHKGARFYVTHGAAMGLNARKAEKYANLSTSIIEWAEELNKLSTQLNIGNLAHPPKDYHLFESFLFEVSIKQNIAVRDLSVDHMKIFPAIFDKLPQRFKAVNSFEIIKTCAISRLVEKINRGIECSVPSRESILHTAPHHDDVMLSYHPAMHDMLGRPKDKNITLDLGEKVNSNKNYFAYLTSGFHSVNEDFLVKQVDALRGKANSYSLLDKIIAEGYLEKDYDSLMTDFYVSFTEKRFEELDFIENVIFVRKVQTLWELNKNNSPTEIRSELVKVLDWLRSDYLNKHIPGDYIPKEIQLLKGYMRESEVDRVWALSRMPMDRVYHLRSKFYNDSFFTPMPSLEDDAQPFADLVEQLQPGIVTVAFDPEGTGPDTHYKVLQVVAAGLRLSRTRGNLKNPDPLVWGYRNVWFVFTPSEASIFIPGSMSDLDLMHDTFMNCFTTQKSASFPSPQYDGPFSLWAKHIQIQQRKALGVLLGESFFQNHPNESVKNSSGFVFIRAMQANHFLKEVEELKSKFQNV